LKGYGVEARVVSMPSWELFERQDAAYRESVLPAAIRKRVTIEAAATFGWHKWAGTDGIVLGIDRYGASAPGEEVMRHFGFTPEHVVFAALRLMGQEPTRPSVKQT
jgi:transketolase